MPWENVQAQNSPWFEGNKAKNPGRLRQTEFPEQSTGEERAAQRENSGDLQSVSLKSSAWYWSVHVYEETAWGYGKNHRKGL